MEFCEPLCEQYKFDFFSVMQKRTNKGNTYDLDLLLSNKKRTIKLWYILCSTIEIDE